LDSQATTPSPVSGADPASEPLIDEARSRIDDIDRRIVDLLRLRRDLSLRIQVVRTRAGGPQTDSAREADIARVYRSFFPDSGDEVAAAVLRACRL